VGKGNAGINVPLTQPITLPLLECNEVPFILHTEEEHCMSMAWSAGTSVYNCALAC